MDILPLPAAEFHLLPHLHQCLCLEVREKQGLPETWSVLPRRIQMSSCSITSLNCMLTSGPVSTWESANITGTNKQLEGHLEVRVSNLLSGSQELMSEGARLIHMGNDLQNKGKCKGMLRTLGSMEPSKSPVLRKQTERPEQNQGLQSSAQTQARCSRQARKHAKKSPLGPRARSRKTFTDPLRSHS